VLAWLLGVSDVILLSFYLQETSTVDKDYQLGDRPLSAAFDSQVSRMLVFYVVPMNALDLMACLFMSDFFLREECYRINRALFLFLIEIFFLQDSQK
jgi:hypothetical protein